jgi:hypothetical protein
MTRAQQTVPDYAIGCMDRSYITIDGGDRDPSIAIWIQTESQYFDLRIRHDRPLLQQLRSLAEYKHEDLLQLTKQSGDTGSCSINNDVAIWSSFGDRFGFYCNDVAIFPDDGRLEPRGEIIYEYDTPKSDFRYEEAWVQQPGDEGLIAHLTLCEEGNPACELATLVLTGRYAGYVERVTSQDESTLETQVAAAGNDLEKIRNILNCEASYAIAPHAAAPYVIRHSTLPFREGEVLDLPVMDQKVLEEREILPSNREGAVWRVESWFMHA